MADIGWTQQYFKNGGNVGKGFSPWGSRRNVINVLRLLKEDPESLLFLGKGKYTFSGVQTTDPLVIHPTERTLEPEALLTSGSRLNFGLTTLKDIRLARKSEEERGRPVKKQEWRSYNVILDGILNVNELQAVLSKDSFQLLQLAGAIEKKKEFAKNEKFTISLSNMPLVSLVWAQPELLGLSCLMQEEVHLRAQQTAINKVVNAFGQEKKIDENIYQEEAQPSDGLTEPYKVSFVTYDLPDYKDKEDYSENYCKLDYEQAVARQKAIRNRLKNVRVAMRIIKFACETAERRGRKVLAWQKTENKRLATHKTEERCELNDVLLRRISWVENIQRSVVAA